MSCVLLITERSDLAADLLVLAAEKRGLEVVRFNQDEFPRHIEVGWHGFGGLSLKSDHFDLTEQDVSGAWFRKPPRAFANGDRVSELVARESDGFLRGVWETASWKWMNHPSAVREGEHKLLQLRRALQLGFEIPDTLVTNAPEQARDFARKQPIVAKMVVGSGLTFHGAHQVIFTTPIDVSDLSTDAEIMSCPVIFQTRVRTAFDLRVTVVGSKVFAAKIAIRGRRNDEIDWRAVEDTRVDYEREDLSQEFASQCIALVSTFGLAYGAIDFVVPEDRRRVFLELNPSGQWGWLERELGFPIADSILTFLTSDGRQVP